jgi:hypothetical protein
MLNSNQEGNPLLHYSITPGNEFIVSEACLTMTAHEISQVLVQKSGGSHVP